MEELREGLRKLLVVEGKDECEFFKCINDYLGLQDVQIVDAAGKDNMKREFPVLRRLPNFRTVRTIGIVRDADDDLQASFESVCGILEKAGLPVPSKVGVFTSRSPSIGVFLTPNNRDAGALEDLCLDTVKERPEYHCASEFVACISELETVPNNLSKSKAQAYLAAMPKACRSIGIGAQKDYWNFDSPHLDPLKEFLQHLRP